MTGEKLDTLQSVELAEGVEIRLRVAGPMLRARAYAVDLVIRLALLMLVSWLLSFADLAVGRRVSQGIAFLLWFLLDWFYPVVFEAGRLGATPGKRVVGLRVVQTSGSPITLGQAVVRNFMRVIDGMPLFTYVFGMTSCLASKRFQRLGDLAAGTVVVYDRLPAFPHLPAPPPIDTVAVPVGLSADEARALVLFRERAALWPEGRRVEIADHLAGLSGARGPKGVSRLMAMAHWIQQQRSGK